VLVFGAFLAIIGITATAQSALVGAHFSTSALNAVVGSDAATTRAFVNAYVSPSDLEAGSPMSPAGRARLESQLATLPRPGAILRVELRRPDGSIIAASDPLASGAQVPVDGDFALALDGTTKAAIRPANAAGAGPGVLGSDTVLTEFLPLSTGGEVRGVVAIWRDAVPILARLDDVRREIVFVTVSAALVAAALLFLIFRSAQGRITRQTAELMEATRRDPLTGLLNHGALVGILAEAIEQARMAGRPLGIALVDIDNFRLLNDNHGHAAGDQALLAVGGLLQRHLGEGMDMGRYGPDEFLIVAAPAAVAGLDPLVDRVRTALVDLSLRFQDTERLPITVSAGIATYPQHADSVTGMLATVGQVIGEAKASGGDTVLHAGAGGALSDTATTSFDVLQGLIIAVDTKDRYTKRHSEDVARYGTFLAERLGLSSDQVHTIGVAGMLHDVGKIGIPDRILRKPGGLTEAEYAVVKQHVALGDMIVRDLPDIDAIRAGIRHHHERWDGEGYLDRLEGEQIPLIARILAVGDAFSAMTTTRPYRKALDIREALQRLGDAAGTQLDERLVSAFIDGIEHAEDPPLPGGDMAPETLLWLPGRRVA
jgi:diguanylate cyclase (GGDEF)-like protein